MTTDKKINNREKKINARIRCLFDTLEQYKKSSKNSKRVYGFVIVLAIIALVAIIYFSFNITSIDSSTLVKDVIKYSDKINETTLIKNILNKHLYEVMTFPKSYKFTTDFIIPVFSIMTTALIALENINETARIDINKNIQEISNQIYDLGFELYLEKKLDDDNEKKFEQYILTAMKK